MSAGYSTASLLLLWEFDAVWGIPFVADWTLSKRLASCSTAGPI